MRAALFLVEFFGDAGKGAGIGEQLGPDVEKLRLADAEDLGRGQAGVGRKLQMQMRRPAAVFLWSPHFADERPGLKLVAGPDPSHRFMCQVTPECDEGRAAVGLVAKRDQAAIAQRIFFDLDADDGGGKGGIEFGAGGHEQVEAEMAGAAGVVDEARDEHLAGIDGALLAEGTDAEFNAMLAAIDFPDRLGFARLFTGRFHGHRM
ncbi:hypothetical protein D9M70_368800 [compost metagenome]